ncbi:MAG: hypothetical protein M3444_04570 [Acidobacteriota bacterium]|nr:hypothetical protein [Acidobacteriota bacterium]MDQ5836771.1 hypothetical protein [Acidobacteriota bacterium]
MKQAGILFVSSQPPSPISPVLDRRNAMNAHAVRTLLQRKNLVPAIVLVLSSFIVVFGFAASGAKTQKENSATSPDEREIDNTVPEHVPIKVKVKNEKSLKDLKNKNWARELELEVKNTGNKPIYYLYMIIGMPDVLIEGHTVSFRMSYGRKKLGLMDTAVEPDDVPILPGESVTLKIPEDQVRGFERFRDEDKRWDDPKKIEIVMQVVNFGDGTSFRGQKGRLMHENPGKRSSNDTRPKEGSGGCKPTPGGHKGRFRRLHQSVLLVPARKPLAGEIFSAGCSSSLAAG